MKDIFGHFSVIRASAIMRSTYKFLQKQLLLSVKVSVSLLLHRWSNTPPFCVNCSLYLVHHFSLHKLDKRGYQLQVLCFNLHLLWKKWTWISSLSFVFSRFFKSSLYFSLILSCIFHFFLVCELGFCCILCCVVDTYERIFLERRKKNADS